MGKRQEKKDFSEATVDARYLDPAYLKNRLSRSENLALA